MASNSQSSSDDDEWNGLKEGMFFHVDDLRNQQGEWTPSDHVGFDLKKPLALSVYITFIDDDLNDAHADIYFRGVDRETGEFKDTKYVTTSFNVIDLHMTNDCNWQGLIPQDDRYWLVDVSDLTPTFVSPEDYLRALTVNRIFRTGIHKAIERVQEENKRRQARFEEDSKRHQARQ
jgi:hypothetical protein